MHRIRMAALAAVLAVCLVGSAAAQLQPQGPTLNGWPGWLQQPTAAMDGYALTYSDTLKQGIWAAMSGGGAPHALLSATHTDTTPAAVTRGALATGQGASPTWSILAAGTTGHVLTMGAAEPAWAAPTSAFVSMAASSLTLATSTIGDLVVNGSFTGDASGWTMGGGGGAPDWAYSSGAVTHGASGGTAALAPAVSLAPTPGARYRVRYTVSGYSAGTLTVSFGGVNDTAKSANGSYSFEVFALSNANLALTPTTTLVATVDDVSVQATDRLGLRNSSAATAAITVQASPYLLWEGHAWTGSVDNSFQWRASVLPVTGTTTTSWWRLTSSKGGAAEVSLARLTDSASTANVGIGYNAAVQPTPGTQSTAVGGYALYMLSTSTSALNSAFGYYSLGATTSGAGNTGLGGYALNQNTTGTNRTAAGLYAGYNASTALSTGTLDTYLGFRATAFADALTDVVAIGANALATKSRQVVLGSPVVQETQLQGALVENTITGGSRYRGSLWEDVTVSTAGATTDTTANLLPAGAVIESVSGLVLVPLADTTSWALGDPTTATRFLTATTDLAAGTRKVGLNHLQGSVSTDAAGPVQGAAAKVRLTTAGGTPTGGKVRVETIYTVYGAPSDIIYSGGDSKTAIPGNLWWQDILANSLATTTGRPWRQLANYGIGGAMVSTYKLVVDSHIAAYNAASFPPPTVVLFSIGVNDAASVLPAEATWETNLAYILDAYHTAWPNATVYLSKPWGRGYAANIATLEGWIDTVRSTRTAWCLAGDRESVWLENGDNGVSRTNEGIHYNAAGATAKAAALYTAMGY